MVESGASADSINSDSVIVSGVGATSGGMTSGAGLGLGGGDATGAEGSSSSIKAGVVDAREALGSA